MKRYCIIFLSLCMLLCACGREMRDADIETVSSAVLGAINESNTLTPADADFTSTNFAPGDDVEAARIYLGENKEIGIFRLKEGVGASTIEGTVRDYLQSEANATSTLLDLYPDEKLEEKLNLYKNATVLQSGRYLCYLVLPKEETEKAKKAFETALSGKHG